MATTRCKFTVQSITLNKSQRLREGVDIVKDKEAAYKQSSYEICALPTVKLVPIMSDDDPESENSKFWSATPSGEITLAINNSYGAEVFEVGEDYYVDFTKVEKAVEA